MGMRANFQFLAPAAGSTFSDRQCGYRPRPGVEKKECLTQQSSHEVLLRQILQGDIDAHFGAGMGDWFGEIAGNAARQVRLTVQQGTGQQQAKSAQDQEQQRNNRFPGPA